MWVVQLRNNVRDGIPCVAHLPALSGQGGFIADQPAVNVQAVFLCDGDIAAGLNFNGIAFGAWVNRVSVPFSETKMLQYSGPTAWQEGGCHGTMWRGCYSKT